MQIKFKTLISDYFLLKAYKLKDMAIIWQLKKNTLQILFHSMKSNSNPCILFKYYKSPEFLITILPLVKGLLDLLWLVVTSSIFTSTSVWDFNDYMLAAMLLWYGGKCENLTPNGNSKYCVIKEYDLSLAASPVYMLAITKNRRLCIFLKIKGPPCHVWWKSAVKIELLLNLKY